MIASITGEVAIRRQDHVVLDCNGVGYKLDVSEQTLKSVPAIGNDCHLFSHLISKEDGISLFGFATEEERDLFLMLISVASVGPKVAVSVLSRAPVRELIGAIAASDVKRFQAAQGVGKKTAERIIVELKDRVAGSQGSSSVAAAIAASDPRFAAREGLMGLGYSIDEAESMLDGLAAESGSAAEMIEAALRKIAVSKD